MTMTPTERAAVAAAIAALEPIAEDPDVWKLTVGHIGNAKRALASLRALAPAPAECRHCKGDQAACDFDICQFRHSGAPADQSDAWRDGVIDGNVAWLERYKKLVDGWMQAAINEQRNATIARIDELNKRRALASAPSETVGRGELETGVEELRALVGKLNGGAEMQELMRLNNGLADKVRNLTTLLDQQLGTPCEEIRHAQEVEKLQALALSTADRDAIREALKANRRWIEETCTAYEWELPAALAKLTAALALIGEG